MGTVAGYYCPGTSAAFARFPSETVYLAMARANGTPVPGSVAKTGSDEITFTPSANMTAATVHIFAISENVRALDDYSPMADSEIINFTTA